MKKFRLVRSEDVGCEPPVRTSQGLEIVVIYTSVRQTLAALRTAGSLARGLNVRIRLVVPEVVPFPALLDRPPVELRFTERKFRTIAEQSAIDTTVDICLCREREAGVLLFLKPGSVVVIGAAEGWWRSRRESRMARTLRRHGHHVLLVESR
jgi:hypothetical protein